MSLDSRRLKKLLGLALFLIVATACDSPTDPPPEMARQTLVETPSKDGGPSCGSYYYDGLAFWFQPTFGLPVDRGGGKAGAKQQYEKYTDPFGNLWEYWYYNAGKERVYVVCMVNGRFVPCEQ